MLRSVIKRKFFIQNIAFYAVFFFVSLCAMEPAQPIKIKKKKKPTLVQRLKGLRHVLPLVNWGLADHLIPQEVMRLISLNLTLQDMGRLNRVRKNAYWDLEHICDCTQVQCNTVACKRLKECIHNTRTKILGHYAKTRNASMFQHILKLDAQNFSVTFLREARRIRDIDSLFIIGINPNSSLKEYMKEYRTRYSSAKKIHKMHCERLVEGSNIVYVGFWFDRYEEIGTILKIILPGTGFNIYESSYRKKRARTNSNYKISTILKRISGTNDVNLLLAAIDGYVRPYMFKSLYENLGWEMIEKLEEKKAIPVDVVDKHGNSARHYHWYKENYHRLNRGGGGVY